MQEINRGMTPSFLRVSSPDERVELRVTQADDGSLSYDILQNGTIVIESSPLGLLTSVADFTDGLTYLTHSRRLINEQYKLIAGKASEACDYCNEITLRFRKLIYEIHIIFRVYDDGIAFRYRVPGTGAISVYQENGGFILPSVSTVWAHDFIEHYEGFYNKHELSQLDGEYGLPILFRHGEDGWALISEAGVTGETGASHLSVSGEDEKRQMKVVFAPDQPTILSHCPFETAWRAVIVSSDLAGIVESNMIETLNPESEISDTSWIQPGRSAWSWWSGDSTSDLDVQKRYVDFAASMGWEYYLCDAGWQESWLPELIDYAGKNGVRLFIWFHHRELQTDDDIESKLSYWADGGIAGIKVDFFESDSQEKLRLYDKLAVATAKYHLLLNYHGCTKPSGERRRWPHLVTREGVLGAEYYNWSEGPTAEHNCTLPFIRNVVGPMDYTPVTYSNLHNQTTFAHQAALCIVFESAVQHFADSVNCYEHLDEGVLKLFRACPAAWDETRLLEGFPGKFVTIARRKGADWFLGSISGDGQPRSVNVPLTFLGDQPYVAHIVRDGVVANQVVCEEYPVHSSRCLHIPLLANGGCAIWMTESSEYGPR